MYCSRRLYKGNSYDFCLPLIDSGVISVRFYTAGDVMVEKVPEISGDSMCFSFTEEDLEYLPDGVLRYELVSEHEFIDTNSPYVVVTPGGYSGGTLDELLEEAYDSGYTSGHTDGYDEGYDIGTGTCAGGYFTITNLNEEIPGEIELIGSGTQLKPVKLRTSYDGRNWSEEVTYTSGGTFTIQPGQSLLFDGGSNGGDWGGSMNQWTFKQSQNCDSSVTFVVHGDISSLNGERGDTMPINRSFIGLFSGFTQLVSAKYLTLPYTEMTGDDYIYMFYGCTALKYGPALPATTLDGECYRGMFWGCSSLLEAPELPASAAAPDCYDSMFWGCTSLTTAPALPATSLRSGCYSDMFRGCTSLTTAPELPATILGDQIGNLAEQCYYNMFRGCTSLTAAPALPATTLTTGCYSQMFMGCTSLTTAPALPATTLAQECYYGMFIGCTSLTAAPALPATTLTTQCYSYMFQNCTGLTDAPALPATTLETSCYSSMFNGCTSLTGAPELPALTLAESCYNSMFESCTSLITAPVLPAPVLANYCYMGMFSRCSSLTGLTCLATNISATSCTMMWCMNIFTVGTFYCDASMINTWTNSESPFTANGIPVNWNKVVYNS